MNVKILTSSFLMAILFLSACKDQGDPVSATGGSASNNPAPTLVSVSPDSGNAADTITIVGTNFGITRGSSSVSFGSTAAAQYLSWDSIQIKVVVPPSLTSGSVNISVSVGGKSSNTKTFKSLSTAVEVSFSTDILPMLNAKGCINCHGGNGRLTVSSVASLLSGGNNGPAIIPGNAAASNIVLKLKGTASFGDRMPQGGPYLSTEEIKLFEDWINAGAKNN